MIRAMVADGAPEDPYDLGRTGYSLANNRELVLRCLEARGARSVVEIGAEHGLFTAELLTWAADRVSVTAIDPAPQPELVALAEQEEALTLVRSPSSEAIPGLPPFDAYIVDGDHNYHTVSLELEAINARSEDEFPLILLHDVSWPHARRDTYYAPDRIPPERRQPIAHHAWISPWSHGLSEGTGLEYEAVATTEGGARNGVLTAVEDFVAREPGLRFARVPAFFGLGVIWATAAAWADDVAAVVEPFADDPVLERLEGNRVTHLLERQRLGRPDAAGASPELAAAQARIAELELELRSLLDSRSFALAERVSSLRGSDGVSRARLRALLDRA